MPPFSDKGRNGMLEENGVDAVGGGGGQAEADKQLVRRETAGKDLLKVFHNKCAFGHCRISQVVIN